MKILIVDSDPKAIEDYCAVIGRIVPDAVCVGTGSADEAAELFDKEPFDTVLLDICPPEIDGILLSKRIFEQKPKVNVIFVSHSGRYALDCWKTNASAFLLKPVSDDALRNALENLRYPISKISGETIAAEYSGANIIGKNIQKIRKERNMPREELAEHLGVRVQTISRWENGKRIPDVLTMLKLAHVFAVEPGDLMY